MITPCRAAAFMTASAFSFGTDHNSVLVRVRARPDADAARCLIAAYSLRRRERSPARPTVTPRRDGGLLQGVDLGLRQGQRAVGGGGGALLDACVKFAQARHVGGGGPLGVQHDEGHIPGPGPGSV